MMTGYIAMDLLHGYRTKGHDGNGGKNLHVGGLVLHGDTHVVIIRFPHSWVLKFMARAVLLAFVVISLPWLGSMIGEINSKFQGGNASDAQFAVDPLKVETLPLLFQDFRNEGLLRMGDRALFVSNGDEDEEAIYNSQILRAYGMDVISYSDSGRQSMIPDETFDFAFMHGIHADIKVIDRVLKVNGIVVVQLNVNPKVSFQKPSNYNIVYLRQFDSTIMAMRKTSHVNDNKSITSPTRRRLLGLTPEAKKAALKKLENVLLEPPRASSGKSNRYLKKTRYLPDLMGDSLESYPRRVFINVAGDAGWFAKHYPTRNKNFEIYEVETVPETTSMGILPGLVKEEAVGAQAPREMSDWLRKTVKEEDYVVMKAEAEVVEEMVRSKTIKLVDELFLECKHQGIKGKSSSSRRPYWECLALYGNLRDEGVAVHQWWG